MKKIILSIVFVVSALQIQAQWFVKGAKGNGHVISTHRTVGNYDRILVTGAFKVALVHGTEGKLDIKIEDNLLDYLITEVEDNQLVIKWKKNTNIRTRKSVHVVVPFKDLEKITLTGSGDVISTDIIKSSHFETVLSGSGDIALNVDAKSIISKITGSGEIKLFGNTDKLKVLLTGSGDFNGVKLKAKDVDAKITGSGNIDLFVSHKIDAKVTGSGDIVFRGQPEFQNLKTTGSGDITSH